MMNYREFQKAYKQDPALTRTLSKEGFKKYSAFYSRIGHPNTVYAAWFCYKSVFN